MPVEEGDCLAWYNDEINRYRDHEWRLASISIAVATAVVLFAKNHDTKEVLSPCALAILVMVSVAFLWIPRCHTHKQLNQFRERRERLLKDIEHKGQERSDKIKAPFLRIGSMPSIGSVLS
jgi:hypothetical protein